MPTASPLQLNPGLNHTGAIPFAPAVLAARRAPFHTHTRARDPSGPHLGLKGYTDYLSDSFHARARLLAAQNVHGRFLRLDYFLLQNCATQRHAVRRPAVGCIDWLGR
jgi:hypothetical protein